MNYMKFSSSLMLHFVHFFIFFSIHRWLIQLRCTQCAPISNVWFRWVSSLLIIDGLDTFFLLFPPQKIYWRCGSSICGWHVPSIIITTTATTIIIIIWIVGLRLIIAWWLATRMPKSYWDGLLLWNKKREEHELVECWNNLDLLTKLVINYIRK